MTKLQNPNIVYRSNTSYDLTTVVDVTYTKQYKNMNAIAGPQLGNFRDQTLFRYVHLSRLIKDHFSNFFMQKLHVISYAEHNCLNNNLKFKKQDI